MMLKQFNEIASYAALIFVFMLILEQRLARIPQFKTLVFLRYTVSWGLAAIGICLMFANIGAPKIALILAALLSAAATALVAYYFDRKAK